MPTLRIYLIEQLTGCVVDTDVIADIGAVDNHLPLFY